MGVQKEKKRNTIINNIKILSSSLNKKYYFKIIKKINFDLEVKRAKRPTNVQRIFFPRNALAECVNTRQTMKKVIKRENQILLERIQFIWTKKTMLY